MTPLLTYQGYGVQAEEVTVVVARVTHVYAIRLNGNRGTAVVLDTGNEVIVSEWQHVVEKQLADALRREVLT